MRFLAAVVVKVGVYGSPGVCGRGGGMCAAAEDGPATGFFSLKSIVANGCERGEGDGDKEWDGGQSRCVNCAALSGGVSRCE